MARRARRTVVALAAVAVAAGAFVTGTASVSATTTTIPGGPGGAVDMTGTASATIAFANFSYSPPSLAVGRSGTAAAELTWTGAFGSHPLRFDALGIASQNDGMSTTRQLRSGRYAYFCNFHGSSLGMKGEVYVAGPRASLTVSPADVAPGGTVTLDASATDLVSYGSATATYAFDPEGDGSFLPAGSATSMQATYPVAGDFGARVRVRDDSGRVDESSFDVDVAPPGTTPPPNAPDPTADPTPEATTGPAGAKGPAKRPTVKFADVATLPGLGRCVDRTSGVRIRVRDSAAVNVRSVRVLVNGRTVRIRSSVSRPLTLAVRPLPRGRPLVKVVVTLAGGKKLSKATRYRTCRG